MPRTIWSQLVNKAKRKTLNLAQLNPYPQFLGWLGPKNLRLSWFRPLFSAKDQ